MEKIIDFGSPMKPPGGQSDKLQVVSSGNEILAYGGVPYGPPTYPESIGFSFQTDFEYCPPIEPSDRRYATPLLEPADMMIVREGNQAATCNCDIWYDHYGLPGPCRRTCPPGRQDEQYGPVSEAKRIMAASAQPSGPHPDVLLAQQIHDSWEDEPELCPSRNMEDPEGDIPAAVYQHDSLRDEPLASDVPTERPAYASATARCVAAVITPILSPDLVRYVMRAYVPNSAPVRIYLDMLWDMCGRNEGQYENLNSSFAHIIRTADMMDVPRRALVLVPSEPGLGVSSILNVLRDIIYPQRAITPYSYADLEPGTSDADFSACTTIIADNIYHCCTSRGSLFLDVLNGVKKNHKFRYGDYTLRANVIVVADGGDDLRALMAHPQATVVYLTGKYIPKTDSDNVRGRVFRRLCLWRERRANQDALARYFRALPL